MGIVLQRNGVLVSMYGCPPQPLEAIKSYMTYDKRETVAERGRIKTAIVPTRFWFEQDGVLIFPCGFIPRVCGIVSTYGLQVEQYHRFDREPRLDYDLSGVDVCGLRPEQEKMLEAFVENEGGQIISPTGCHAYGQGILMYDGSVKQVQDVSVGDLLMGPDSLPREVKQLCRGRGKMYRIVPVKGDSWVVNEDHMLSLIGDGVCIVDVSVKEWVHWPSSRKSVYGLFRKTGNNLEDVLRTGFRVEELETEDYYGFVLDGDHRYLLSDFTVTHNSGKSWGLRELCCLYPNARIIVAAPGRETTATMKRYLVDKFGEDNIGQVGGGKRHTRRITCTTYDSVLKVEDLHKVDILIADEGHRSPAVKYEQRFMSVTSPVKRFMFTATPEGRSDNAELTMEALFGPQVVNIAYQDTVKSGSVLPIHVIVKDQPHGPDEQTVRQIPVGPKRDRVCIWRNNDRNKMIVEDVLETMKQYEDPQVLILVDKTEHALVLHSLLPDFHMVHGELDVKRKARLIKQGLLGMGEKTMTSKERDAAREAFESGELKRVLATQVFATGVSSNHCQIVGIASGTGSIIQFLQSIGRAGRKCDEIGKTHATVLIWRDTFAKSYTARAAKLVTAARKQGHKITRVQWIPK